VRCARTGLQKNMHDESHDLLNDPNKGVETAEGVLARLFRQILFDLNVRPIRWAAMMARYLDDPRNGIPKNSRDRSSARGNLNKELRRPKMTWKVFRKALMFLGPLRVRFIVELDWKDRDTTVHMVQLNNCTDEDSDGVTAADTDDEY
jgi:hypothetical protein